MPVAIYNLEPYGDMVLYEDYLVEVANLNHIIAALEGQLKAESQELGSLKIKSRCIICNEVGGHGGLPCPDLIIT